MYPSIFNIQKDDTPYFTKPLGWQYTDILWWKPHKQVGDMPVQGLDYYTHHCIRCEVIWREREPVPRHPRCFVCNKFVPRITTFDGDYKIRKDFSFIIYG